MDTSKKYKKVAILQSNYIPWKGYFDLIRSVDEFIIYDDVQYTKNDWRNRNLIKTANGLHWLTIPISVKGKFKQNINDAKVSDPEWQQKHWKTICMAYSKAKHFNVYKDVFEEMYINCREEFLSAINLKFILLINKLLNINTIIKSSSDYLKTTGKNEKIIEMCLQAQADEYISGPSARNYIDQQQFEENSIKLSFIGYDGYKTYDQLFPPFKHEVSIIDLIFNTGPEAENYMKVKNSM